MKLLSLTLATSATLAAAAQPYSTLLADSIIDRKTKLGLSDAGEPFITYEHGVLERALESVYNKTNNVTYLNYARAGVDAVIGSNGLLLDYNLTYYTLDDIRIGPAILSNYIRYGSTKYKTAAAQLRQQVIQQPRNPAGGFWHRSTYPNQMWLDGLYMVEPFYAQYTQLFQPNNATAWADITNQFTLVEENTRNATTGLLAHGYDSSFTAQWADPPLGVSPEVWDRALGWYTMALVDVLDYFPASQPGRATLIAYFKRVMAAVKAAQDSASGGWWLVMSQPGRTGNYIESSGSAMFVYSAIKGVRVGLLDKADYSDLIETGYNKLTSWVTPVGNGTYNWEGTVQVGSLSGTGDFDYYISVPLRQNDAKGLGPMIFASIEYEKYTTGK